MIHTDTKHKVYIRLNAMAIFFLVISSISVTLAWFAYSGLSKVESDIGVKAWRIKLERNGAEVTNELTIPLYNISPGMDMVSETVNIKNLGDSDAAIKYDIISVRILDNEYVVGDTLTSEQLEDEISHKYPFHINMNLDRKYAVSNLGEANFNISVSWPLDSDNNTDDSKFGADSYEFNERNKASGNTLPTIKVKLRLTAEQYIKNENAIDPKYNLGDTVLYNPIDNKPCTSISSTCLSTTVIDVNNKIGDANTSTVTLLPTVLNTYVNSTYDKYTDNYTALTSGWKVGHRPLVVGDILKVISTDILNSNLKREGLSDQIIGYMATNERINTEVAKVINDAKYTGYYEYLNEKFPYLSATNCYWTNTAYKDAAFAVKKENETNTKLYKETSTASCNIIPVITLLKKDNN